MACFPFSLAAARLHCPARLALAHLPAWVGGRAGWVACPSNAMVSGRPLYPSQKTTAFYIKSVIVVFPNLFLSVTLGKEFRETAYNLYYLCKLQPLMWGVAAFAINETLRLRRTGSLWGPQFPHREPFEAVAGCGFSSLQTAAPWRVWASFNPPVPQHPPVLGGAAASF